MYRSNLASLCHAGNGVRNRGTRPLSWSTCPIVLCFLPTSIASPIPPIRSSHSAGFSRFSHSCRASRTTEQGRSRPDTPPRPARSAAPAQRLYSLSPETFGQSRIRPNPPSSHRRRDGFAETDRMSEYGHLAEIECSLNRAYLR